MVAGLEISLHISSSEGICKEMDLTPCDLANCLQIIKSIDRVNTDLKWDVGNALLLNLFEYLRYWSMVDMKARWTIAALVLVW